MDRCCGSFPEAVAALRGAGFESNEAAHGGMVVEEGGLQDARPAQGRRTRRIDRREPPVKSKRLHPHTSRPGVTSGYCQAGRNRTGGGLRLSCQLGRLAYVAALATRSTALPLLPLRPDFGRLGLCESPGTAVSEPPGRPLITRSAASRPSNPDGRDPIRHIIAQKVPQAKGQPIKLPSCRPDAAEYREPPKFLTFEFAGCWHLVHSGKSTSSPNFAAQKARMAAMSGVAPGQWRARGSVCANQLPVSGAPG